MLKRRPTKGIVPSMDQVTSVAAPRGCSVNSMLLRPSMGLRMRSSMRIFCGAASTRCRLPAPELPPSKWKAAPGPCDGPWYWPFMAGSLAKGFQVLNWRRSAISG